MIIVNNAGLTGDPTNAKVEIDRRMLDFCVGLDTEFSEIVEGSHLYFPKTKFEQVNNSYYSSLVHHMYLMAEFIQLSTCHVHEHVYTCTCTCAYIGSIACYHSCTLYMYTYNVRCTYLHKCTMICIGVYTPSSFVLPTYLQFPLILPHFSLSLPPSLPPPPSFIR